MTNHNFAAMVTQLFPAMKRILFVVLFSSQCAFVFSQRLRKSDRAIVENLKTTIHFLADDKLEGRRAGTAGEKSASEFIISQYKAANLTPKGDKDTYLQSFEIKDGKQINKATLFMVNGKELSVQKDYFPLAFSANASVAEIPVATSLSERGAPWFKDIEAVIAENRKNPHFDIYEYIKKEAGIAAQKGATALILFNSENGEDNVQFNKKDKSELLAIPVIYLTKSGKETYLGDASSIYDIKLKVDIGESKRTGHNVIGYINNNAASTVIIGAHYDHLGYGEDGNSMLRNGQKQIHNGADDNASGTAAVIELAKLLSESKSKNNNYLFIAFSGEELGLFGSKYFTEHPTVDLSSVNYMINMDMVGRLSDSTKTLTVGGYGTSPAWSEVLYDQKRLPFSIKIDSSGAGPSDHTSFYRKDIPVLFFFTGLHQDYHKPSDDADKINYVGELQIIKYIAGLVKDLNKKDKLAFTPTKDTQMTTTAKFSVTLGIMPDYTYSGSGVRVDGVSDGRPAQKAGLKTGDVVVRLGEYTVNSLETYMQALSKFKNGDSTTVNVKRGNEDLKFDITFVK
ncbi:M28 family peptidase [Agriterribacter humi]|jgi:Zn-dependent M28 family amino/carboxypeptidase|uniref:M28 family peptidase n=1 Tax=Agriterribacter humi TaxID=1104781 RepID=UPI001263F7B0|nr:M28 family peptidase [Agriterribacter humi]